MPHAPEIPPDYYLVPRGPLWEVHLDGWGLIADGFDTYAEAAQAAHRHSFTLPDDLEAAP